MHVCMYTGVVVNIITYCIALDNIDTDEVGWLTIDTIVIEMITMSHAHLFLQQILLHHHHMAYAGHGMG